MALRAVNGLKYIFRNVSESKRRAATSGVKHFATNSALYSLRSSSRSLWYAHGICQNRPKNSEISKCETLVNARRSIHSKGDEELVQFLAEEIAAETKAQKSPKLPKIEGFDIKSDGSKVTLTSKFHDENIVVKFNVNHTVDTVLPEAEINPNQERQEEGEMQSKPSFTVEIEKNGKTLAFSCTFVQEYTPEEKADPDAFNDLFNIDEVVMHTGDWNENTYAVSGEIIDGYLYDLLMNLLEERGITNEFAEKLIDFSTSYEQKLYIDLLENMKAFVSGKLTEMQSKTKMTN